MARFDGKHGRGYMRKVREQKRTEAEIRNEAYQERLAEAREIKIVSMPVPQDQLDEQRAGRGLRRSN